MASPQSQIMTVKVSSLIPWKTDLLPEYTVDSNTTIRKFCEAIGIEWDVEALVFINNQIAHGNEILQQGDHILLMVPVVGG
ncbi:MoaD/ThiS family protein [Ferviditalea candida]|uniref:MoaD/ThiS family protein n=1 Tax=Ferviditalea candida TaxID=3108399 RepID=A0ABU5ZNB1_9BACL|nr:MoaD/ThiS family protein [Paenibacillaceae bacterium T2]